MQQNYYPVSIQIVCFYCVDAMLLLSICLSDTHMTEHPLRHTQTHMHMHTLLQKTQCPFSMLSGMWYSTCRESSRRSAWSSFFINHSACCCLTARLTACNSTKWLRGLRTAITAREPTSSVHPLHTALYSPACLHSFVCPLAVGKQMTKNPDRQPHSSLMHSERMK